MSSVGFCVRGLVAFRLEGETGMVGRRGSCGLRQERLREGKRGGPLTVLDIAVLDLLQHLGPDRRVGLLVLVDELGFQLHDLREPPAGVPHPRRRGNLGAVGGARACCGDGGVFPHLGR